MALEAGAVGERDPFAFGGAYCATCGQKSGSAGMTLEMTVISDGAKFAVINGARYKVGDKVGGAEITAINLDSVVLVKNGETVTIRSGEWK